MTETTIPDRASTRYAQQYAGSVDPDRLIQICTDAVSIALQSKDPDTAEARRDLAIEAYHQLRELNAHHAIHETIVTMLNEFPVCVRLNAARGMVAKAAKLKTPGRRAEILRQAASILATSQGAAAEDPQIQCLKQSIASDLADFGSE